MTPEVIALVGPTASGKSALAEKLAAYLGGPVISVDAMQVYKGMDIGTAKVPEGERRAPLAMVDLVDIATPYSVQLFQRDARCLVDAQIALGQPAVLAGGTGLYLSAVIDEMDFPAGQTTSAYRQELEAFVAKQGEQALYERLERLDPQSAACIHPHNVRRVIRALEMAAEGISYADKRNNFRHIPAHYTARIFGLAWPRELLYERINLRVDQMMEQGLLDEVKRCVAAGLRANPTASQAIGYKELLGVLDQTMTLDEAVALLKQQTRRYAKRQLSWFRRDPRVEWIDMQTVDDPFAYLLDALGIET